MSEDIRKNTARVREQARKGLARRLHRALLEKGWSASELARRAGLTRDNISTYMNAYTLPTPQSLAKLARALGTTPEELIPNAPNAPLVDPDSPVLEITASSNGMAHLRVDKIVSYDLALQVARLLQDASNDDNAAD